MSYQPASAREIEQRITLRIAGQVIPLTDLTEISTLKQLIKLMAVEEFAALHRGLAEAVSRWHLDSATGTDLERRIADFGVTRPGPQQAYGILSIAVTQPTDVPAGAIFQTVSGRTYAARFNSSPEAGLGDVGDGSWHIENSREILIEASVAGAAGNATANSVVVAGSGAANIDTVTNPAPITNGRDALTDAELRQYFKDWMDALNGCSRGAVLFEILGYLDAATQRRVRSAAVQEWDGAEWLVSGGKNVAMVVYIDEGIGASAAESATAHPGLVAAVQKHLDGSDSQEDQGVRPAGTPTAVEAARARLIDVDVHVDVDSKYGATTVADQVRVAITNHIAGLPVGGRLISGELQGQLVLARLVNDVQDLPGVLDARFGAPLGNIPIPTGYKAVAGAISITTTVING